MAEHSPRIERDTFGPIEVPAERLWGAQTQRSLEHFRISTEHMPEALIRALRPSSGRRRGQPGLGLLRRGSPTRSSRPPTRCSPGGTPRSSRSRSGRPDRARRPT